MFAADYDVTVDGVELGEAGVRRARALTAEAGLAAKVRFHVGDAERIPLPAGVFDAAVRECAFCTFPDKTATAGEFARVLRPGGRVGITDVTVAEGGLPKELTTLAAWVACIADARPLAEYAAILDRTRVAHDPHRGPRRGFAADDRRDRARLRLLRMTAPERLCEVGVDVGAVSSYLALAKQAVADGQLGYALLVAQKPS